MNPPYKEKILTPKGVEVDFETFLFGGNKAKYRDTSRDECADSVAEAISKLKPAKPIIDFPQTPTLYVTECGKTPRSRILSMARITLMFTGKRQCSEKPMKVLVMLTSILMIK